MFVTDIWNRFLLMNADMADQIDYTYDGSGYITQEVRRITTKTGNLTIIKKITVTYTRDGSGYITQKTIKFETEQTPFV